MESICRTSTSSLKYFEPAGCQFPVPTCPIQGPFTLEKKDGPLTCPAFSSGSSLQGGKISRALNERQLEEAALLRENQGSKVERISKKYLNGQSLPSSRIPGRVAI